MSDHQLQFWPDVHNRAEMVADIFTDAYGSEREKDATFLKSLCMAPVCFGMIAHIDQKPAGFILLQQADDSADIIEISVRTALQKKGIGRQLLEQALSHARIRCLTRVLLEVAVTNQPALKLYRSAGFSLVAKRPQYYHQKSGKIDALVMAHSLKEADEV